MTLPPRNALLVAAFYAFFYGAIGCLIPYLPLYYQSIGLTGEQIGLLLGLGSIVLLISGPLWGAVGDRFNLHRWLLPIATAGALLPMALLPLTRDLTVLIVIIVAQAFFSQAIIPLMDSAALEISETTGTPFGQLRLGGSIGFTLFSTSMGWLLTRIPLVWIFYGYMIGMALATLVALPLPARKHHWREPLTSGLRALIAQPALTFFLGGAFLVGLAMSSLMFFFPFFISDIGGDSSVLGLAGAIGALAEIPVMFNANKIIKRLGGLWNSVAFAILLYAFRMAALSFATHPLQVFALQTLHGITFGLFIIAAIAYVQDRAPQGLSATAQSLFTVAVFGLGAFSGSFGGGFVYEAFGSPAIFRIAAVACVLALGLLFGSRQAARTQP